MQVNFVGAGRTALVVLVAVYGGGDVVGYFVTRYLDESEFLSYCVAYWTGECVTYDDVRDT